MLVEMSLFISHASSPSCSVSKGLLGDAGVGGEGEKSGGRGMRGGKDFGRSREEVWSLVRGRG